MHNRNDKQKLADAVSGQPLPIWIKNDSSGEKRKFEIKQVSFASLIRCSRIFSEIDIKEIQDLFEQKNMFEFIANHADKLLQIISICLDNNPCYSNKTYNFVKQNLTPAEAYDLLGNIVLRIGTSDFQKSIVATGATSLFNQTEIIAVLSSTRSNS